MNPTSKLIEMQLEQMNIQNPVISLRTSFHEDNDSSRGQQLIDALISADDDIDRQAIEEFHRLKAAERNEFEFTEIDEEQPFVFDEEFQTVNEQVRFFNSNQ